METNNDKIYGYWIDLSKPFFAETADGRENRETALQMFRFKEQGVNSLAHRKKIMDEFSNAMALTHRELVFGLQLAMREQLTCRQ